MKTHWQNLFFALICMCGSSHTFSQSRQQFVTSDITNFLDAYDRMQNIADTVEKAKILQQFYLDKASPGLRDLMQAKNYESAEFLSYMQNSPRFWQSIHPNLLNISSTLDDINSDISKLKQLYPDLKPATIYFMVGAFRSNGTTLGSNVLISAETALADQLTIIDELPEWRQPFYRNNNPKSGIALLCTHEYIHTQQKALVHNLLSKSLYEGVAEFVSCIATGKQSMSPAIAFGMANQKLVVAKFVEDLFLMGNDSNWLWGENANELQVRDLGYYIGYEICERYYNLSNNKTQAIKDLIELDYHDETTVERIVNSTQLLPKPLSELYADYESKRPKVVAVTPFVPGKKIQPGNTQITITFSEPLNGHNTGIDYGPLGQQHFPKINTNRIWSADRKSWTLEADLEPNKHYQILISNNFRKQDGVRLKPFLIEFYTTD